MTHIKRNTQYLVCQRVFDIKGDKMKKLIYLSIILLILSASAQAQSGLSVHGYLNQAFAFTDGYQIFGIPENSTTDYRNLALQFRYDVNEYNNFVIQFSHKRAGLNPLMVIEEDVRLDWGYFEHRFDNGFSLKAGKIQLPFGNYNEYRDVGVLLPFYRVPFSPYGEGNYMSETLDGLRLTYVTEFASSWFLHFDIYGGHWTWEEWFVFNNPVSGGVVESIGIIDVNNGYGGQLKIETPLEELEFRFGAQHAEPTGGVSFSKGGYFGKQMSLNLFSFSIKGEFEDFFVGSDIMKIEVNNHPMSPLLYNSQFGYHITHALDFNLQYEVFSVDNLLVPDYLTNIVGKTSLDINYNKDFALGLKYTFSSNLVLKAETHWNEGFFVEDIAVNNLMDDPYKTQYTIISIATSF